jgi:hypothetical protein
MLRFELTLVALLLLSLAGYIFFKQRRAKSCSKHNRMAGYLAIAISIISVLLAVALLAAAWSMIR